jgi:Carboxypeptidase regulatory-like domain
MFAFRRLRPLAGFALGLVLLHVNAVSGQSPGSEHTATVDAKFRVAGTVVSATTGTPLAQARVSIIDVTNRSNRQSMLTSEDGHFEFNRLRAGKYSLGAQRRGFIAAAYDQHGPYLTAIVTGAGLDTDDLIIRLAPAAMLAGQVVDESGDPVRHAKVSLFLEDHREGFGRIWISSVSTDDRGSYEFAELIAGTHRLAVEATPWYAVHPSRMAGGETLPPAVDASLDVAYPTTYYADSTNPDQATPISIKDGDHLQIDIHLTPVPALHLLVHVPETGGFILPVFQERVFGSSEFHRDAGVQMVSRGVVELTGLPPGGYRVRMVGPTRQPQQSVDVNLDNDVQELNTSAGEPTSTIIASVRVQNEAKLPQHLYIGLLDSERRMVVSGPVDSKGDARIEGIPPGKYSVRSYTYLPPAWPGKGYPVAGIAYEGSEIPGHTLNVTPGASLAISVSLVGGGVNVDGFAKRAGKAAPGATIVLIPKDPESHEELFQFDQSNLDGSFELRNVIPGTYTVIAVENGWGPDWVQPGVHTRYLQHGQTLTVDDRSRGSIQMPEAIEVQPR